MNKILKNKIYKTSDISLCSTLCCFGYNIEQIDTNNPHRVIFLIKYDDNLDSLIKSFFDHKLKVDPLKLLGFLKEIKTRIYNS